MSEPQPYRRRIWRRSHQPCTCRRPLPYDLFGVRGLIQCPHCGRMRLVGPDVPVDYSSGPADEPERDGPPGINEMGEIIRDTATEFRFRRRLHIAAKNDEMKEPHPVIHWAETAFFSAGGIVGLWLGLLVFAMLVIGVVLMIASRGQP